jgi:hypothetical protein
MPSKQLKKTSVKTIAAAIGPGAKARAIHLSDEDSHLVGIGSLRVIICRDGSEWFAQGLEIDYAASGETVEHAKKNFQDGLKGTINLHLQVHGGIEKLLKMAPQRVWRQLWSGRHYQHTQVSIHDDISKTLGFEDIKYFEPEAAA